MKKRNSPIKQLIRNFSMHIRGTVAQSRKEIKIRFDYLDWKDQKAIINAFLDASAKDRDWIYTKLFDYWDDSFASKIQSLWEDLHEERCGWIVIKYLPEDYVYSQIEQFKGKYDYYFVCKRLAKYPSFEIDKNKFKYAPNEYLYIRTLQETSIPEKEAEEIIFGMLRDIAYHNDVKCEFGYLENVSMPSVTYCIEINRAVSDLEKLNCPETLKKFYGFNSKVAHNYYFQKQCLAHDGLDISSRDALRHTMKFFFEHGYEEYKDLPSVLPRHEYYSVPSPTEEIKTGRVYPIPGKIDGTETKLWNKMKESYPELENLELSLELTSIQSEDISNSFNLPDDVSQWPF